jgi:formylglycine-generating enzyme required for sulfatase activity
LADDFIELMRRDTGLLQERGYRRFSFLHLTFEEYLAARGLLESVTINDPADLFHAYAADPRWREVLRLAIGAAPQREAQRLLLHLLSAPAHPADAGRPIILAAEGLLDIGRAGTTNRVWEAVLRALLQLPGDPQIAAEIRLAAGMLIGSLGDPRAIDLRSGQAAGASAYGLADYWCTLEAGSFWVGDERPVGRRARTKTLQSIELEYPAQIARIPVTNAEFQRFIADGGYREQRWWSKTGWDYLHPGGRRNIHNGQVIDQPEHWQNSAYNNPAQPVVGISWYEAAAYCAWLAEQGRRAGWLGRHERLRLPTAIEWERAARHIDQRSYPWGNESPTADHAGFGGSMRAPAPAGCFPRGAAACGALDLAGNVWEWTAGLTATRQERTALEDIALGAEVVIKGGAYNWEADTLRCGAYYWFKPEQRHNLLGFRIVRVRER